MLLPKNTVRGRRNGGIEAYKSTNACLFEGNMLPPFNTYTHLAILKLKVLIVCAWCVHTCRKSPAKMAGVILTHSSMLANGNMLANGTHGRMVWQLSLLARTIVTWVESKFSRRFFFFFFFKGGIKINQIVTIDWLFLVFFQWWSTAQWKESVYQS